MSTNNDTCDFFGSSVWVFAVLLIRTYGRFSLTVCDCEVYFIGKTLVMMQITNDCKVFLFSKNATKTLMMMQTAYKNKDVSKRQIYEWLKGRNAKLSLK